MERLEYDLLFRWFVGIGVDDAAWNHSVFSKNATGCWKATSLQSFWRRCWPSPRSRSFCRRTLFVDGTLIEAWASMKSVKPKDGSGEPPAQGGGRNADADFHG